MDASKLELGAGISQDDNPIASYSMKLSSAQDNYIPYAEIGASLQQ